MPALLPFIPAALAYAIEAVVIAYSFYETQRQAASARKKAKDAYNDSVQDRLVTIRSGVSARKYVLGTIRTNGALLYASSVDSTE